MVLACCWLHDCSNARGLVQVYCWQTVCALELWGRLLGAHAENQVRVPRAFRPHHRLRSSQPACEPMQSVTHQQQDDRHIVADRGQPTTHGARCTGAAAAGVPSHAAAAGGGALGAQPHLLPPPPSAPAGVRPRPVQHACARVDFAGLPVQSALNPCSQPAITLSGLSGQAAGCCATLTLGLLLPIPAKGPLESSPISPEPRLLVLGNNPAHSATSNIPRVRVDATQPVPVTSLACTFKCMMHSEPGPCTHGDQQEAVCRPCRR